MTRLSRRRILRIAGATAATGTISGVGAGDDPAYVGEDFDEHEWGYVRNDFEPPQGEDVPTIFTMDGYMGASSGEEPTDIQNGIPPTHYVRVRDGELLAISILTDHPLAPDEFALAWASVRGTGCSSGQFDLFDRTTAHDGSELIEWVADRPWSLNRVGIFGASYSAILGTFIAATRPPSLTAACLSASYADLYRDVVMVGGVPNPVHPAAWTQFYRRAPDTAGTSQGVTAGDEICAQNVATRDRQNPQDNEALLYARRTDDATWRTHSPLHYAENIEIPVFYSTAWQDQGLGPRGPVELFKAIDPEPASPPGTPGAENPNRREVHESPKLLRTSNGLHNTAHVIAIEAAGDWFRYWLLGEDTGIMDDPPVQNHFNARGTGLGDSLGADEFRYDRESWYDVDWQRLFLGADGALTTDCPETGADAYVTGSSRRSWSHYDRENSDRTEPVMEVEGPDSLVYETAAFEEPKLLAGAGTATLFVESTAPEFDLYVRLSRVRDGGIEPLQRGLLRASHRAVDESRTDYTPDGDIARPFHPHTNPQNPTPGETNRYDVEIFPSTHVIYPGNRLRITVATPPASEYRWGYEPSRAPGVNTVLRGGSDERASRLVVPLQPWPADESDLPSELECGGVAGIRCIE